MAIVYAWPPVRAVARNWSVLDPVSRSKSLITGGEYVSQAQRRRRVAALEVSARFSPHQAGDGYMEALKRLLKGGVNLVRLNYTKAPRCFLPSAEERGGNYFEWFTPPVGFDWHNPPTTFPWFNGTVLAYVPGGTELQPTITVSGLPPNTLAVLPGEFVVAWQGETATRAMVIAPATSDAAGIAVVKLESPVPPGSRVSLGDFDTGVFAVDAMPSPMESARGDWTYSWTFTEVFDDEGRGPFTEYNPWT